MSLLNLEKKTGYNVTCKRCGKKNLKWVPNQYTKSGWQLEEIDGSGHDCYTQPKITERDQLIAQFWNECVIHEEDSEQVVQEKIRKQRSLMWIPEECEKIDINIMLDQNMTFYTKYTFKS